MVNLRLFEWSAVTDPMSLSYVEHSSSECSPTMQFDAVVGWPCVFANEFVFLDVIRLLADGLPR